MTRATGVGIRRALGQPEDMSEWEKPELGDHATLSLPPSVTARRRMQRRGKSQLRIASPGQNSLHMGSDHEKLSRFSRRNLGVTNRIWLIVALFISLILLTHYVLPAHTSAFSQPTYSNANLKAKNYLKPDEENARLSNPFDFCPAHSPMDEVGNKYGAVRLGQSRLHVGSGARVQRVLNRALAGYPVTISVIGGSGTFLIQRSQ
jgi:hypothetical protein